MINWLQIVKNISFESFWNHQNMSGQPARTHEDIEAQIAAIQARRAERPDDEDVPKENERIGLSEVGAFDSDLYGATGKKKFEGQYRWL